MKLPKKLSDSYIDRLFEEGKDHEWVIAKMFNQLIDYLKEDSKGEPGMGSVNVAICDKCDSFYKAVHEKCHPPQQEESRGECEHFYGYLPRLRFGDLVIPKRCKYCGEREPQLKEESPKEDEWEAFDKKFPLLRVMGRPNDIDSFCEDEIKDYIKANFVSKVKIKDVLRDVKDGGEFYTRQAVNEIFEKLGLEEL